MGAVGRHAHAGGGISGVRVLTGAEWRDGLLDYWRAPREYRVRALAWQNLAELDALYFVRPGNPRTLINYLHEVGPIEVFRKVRSRRQERYRNEKFLSCGVGSVVEGPLGNACYPVDALVGFIAPCHPPCVERLVVPPELLFGVDPSRLPALSRDEVLYLGADGSVPEAGFGSIAGWSRDAGVTLDQATTEAKVGDAVESIYTASWTVARHLPVDRVSMPSERSPQPARNGRTRARRKRRISAVLFGYGNYAKTHVIPSVHGLLDVRCIHELDPTQIPSDGGSPFQWDTSPLPRPSERYDAYLVAGYHSTHVPLAIEALTRGASVAVEKPIAVDDGQLAGLITSLESSRGRLFSCFQRRYSPLNALALQDLGVARNDPVSYHCIVYEVPLPRLHWYRWPSSGSRLLSNGCHWIDHFLYLNGFQRLRSMDLHVATNSTVNCSLELENGALFTMVLTDLGSPRVGVQDHVELRAGNATVRIVNNTRYLSERGDRALRSTRVSRVQSYRRMYSWIARAIQEGRPGESPQSISRSAGTVLGLETLLRTSAAEQSAGDAAAATAALD
jgi:predicted dehydrogenase